MGRLERELERRENDNKIFISDSGSDESSGEEESKSGGVTRGGVLSSFDDSTNTPNDFSNDADRTKTNTTAKSSESGRESTSKAF